MHHLLLVVGSLSSGQCRRARYCRLASYPLAPDTSQTCHLPGGTRHLEELVHTRRGYIYGLDRSVHSASPQHPRTAARLSSSDPSCSQPAKRTASCSQRQLLLELGANLQA